MIHKALDEYQKYARDNVPSIFFVVMLWQGAKEIIDATIARWNPGLAGWPLGMALIAIASGGLYLISKLKKENKK